MWEGHRILEFWVSRNTASWIQKEQQERGQQERRQETDEENYSAVNKRYLS